jgi:Asp/Glu/hydantoin racemase
MSQKLDSLNNKTVTLKQLNKIVVLEGLKNEKRMIQSTDRKLLDLNREKEIDKEIKNID